MVVRRKALRKGVGLRVSAEPSIPPLAMPQCSQTENLSVRKVSGLELARNPLLGYDNYDITRAGNAAGVTVQHTTKYTALSPSEKYTRNIIVMVLSTF